MSTLDADLENFLTKVLDPRAVDKARNACITEDIFNIATLMVLRDNNELNDIFTKGTAAHIRRELPGRLNLMLVIVVVGDTCFNEVI